MAKPMKTLGTTLTLEELSLDELLSIINDLVTQGSTHQYQIGVLYNHIVDRKLAELAGYKTTQLYFSTNVKALSQATLSLYGKVARAVTVEVCTQYGMYRLRALLSYAEATLVSLPADPGTMLVEVPQDDGNVVPKPFSKCSVDEVERATRAKKTPPPARVPVPDQARLLFIEDSIFQKFTGVAQVRFSAHNEGGKTFLNLQNVPMTEVTRLIQALQEGLDAQPSLMAK